MNRGDEQHLHGPFQQNASLDDIAAAIDRGADPADINVMVESIVYMLVDVCLRHERRADVHQKTIGVQWQRALSAEEGLAHEFFKCRDRDSKIVRLKDALKGANQDAADAEQWSRDAEARLLNADKEIERLEDKLSQHENGEGIEDQRWASMRIGCGPLTKP